MVGNVIKRVVNTAVVGLAALTFFLVPIGAKTDFQHSVAIFTSKPAKEAGTAISETSRKVATVIQNELERAARTQPVEKPKPPPKNHTP
ncbi:MAG: hypothetical protein IPK82_05935 [Polyangiaceae bacterium]|nr:hypothetical protein [Polyangiaceae bacterium]